MGDYEIVVAQAPVRGVYDLSTMTCRLPATDTSEATSFLRVISEGGAGGTGYRMLRLGVEMPALRNEYEEAVRRLVLGAEQRMAANTPLPEVAEWAVQERTGIARRIRFKQGLSPALLFEIRDNVKYGLGGRTFQNMYKRTVRAGFEGDAAYTRLISKAMEPNVEITSTMLKGARYLKYGGRVVIVVSVATTGYRLLTTPREQLPRVLAEEGGGMVGGSFGTTVGVGLCLVFGVATGGWGLLACGALGGVAGGALGSYTGGKLFYSSDNDAVNQAETQGMIDVSLLEDELPDALPACY